MLPWHTTTKLGWIKKKKNISPNYENLKPQKLFMKIQNNPNHIDFSLKMHSYLVSEMEKLPLLPYLYL